MKTKSAAELISAKKQYLRSELIKGLAETRDRLKRSEKRVRGDKYPLEVHSATLEIADLLGTAQTIEVLQELEDLMGS